MNVLALVTQNSRSSMDSLPEVLVAVLMLLGAASFGSIVGWLVYYINRYRTSAVQFTDLVTVIGIIGGGAVLALFPAGSALFGAYGIGLAVGFFAYFARLQNLVKRSMETGGAFNWEWFLDGRRRHPKEGEGYGTSDGKPAPQTAMGVPNSPAIAPAP